MHPHPLHSFAAPPTHPKPTPTCISIPLVAARVGRRKGVWGLYLLIPSSSCRIKTCSFMFIITTIKQDRERTVCGMMAELLGGAVLEGGWVGREGVVAIGVERHIHRQRIDRLPAPAAVSSNASAAACQPLLAVCQPRRQTFRQVR